MPTISAGLMRGARTLPSRVGRRGVCLLFLAELDLMYALSMLAPTAQATQSPTWVFLTAFMPMWWWAVIWGAVGIVCTVFAFKRKDGIAFGCAIALKTFWALVLGLGWTIGEVERGWLSLAFWGTFAVFVLVISGWRENNEH